MNNTEIIEFAKKALHLVRINVPYLAIITNDIELAATKKIKTAGIFASGRLIFNSDWFSQLTLKQATFIIAHEIMHLAYQSHYRSIHSDKQLFNITHDFIINEQLKELLGVYEVPANGLDWTKEFSDYYPINNKPAEELLRFIKDALNQGSIDKNILYRNHWGQIVNSENKTTNTPMADALKGLLKSPTIESSNEADTILGNNDVYDEKLEEKLFPEEPKRRIRNNCNNIKKKAEKVLSSKLIIESQHDNFGKGLASGANSDTFKAIKTYYKPPWELALQQWMEFTQRTTKTYNKPSRRGQYKDIIRPGYNREGSTLHIIIDTSGSMYSTIGIILGVIANFCDSLMIPQVHIIQCDTQITDDNWYNPTELNNFEIKGIGGSDMRPAMKKLAKDSQVQSALVITDGMIDYPQEPVPYEVLWVITEESIWDFFDPSYGTILNISNHTSE